MLLTIGTTFSPATDLGYLLHKNPGRVQEFDLAFGRAVVFYTEASEHRCTAVLMVEVDPVGLVRKGDGERGGFALEQYVNDRPYAASSLLAVAIAQVFGTALSGTCKQRPELAEAEIALEIGIPVLPARGGQQLIHDLFEPLGYEVVTERLEGGPYYRVVLRVKARLSEALSHLYVLIPVLDDDKHYWIDDAEVEKLLRHGQAWLPGHPRQEMIVTRYLKYQKHLQRRASEALKAVAQLEAEETPVPEVAAEEEPLERPISLNDQRHQAVIEALKECGASRVLDLGCAQGKLLRRLLEEKQFTRVTGLDVSIKALEVAADRLNLERLSEAKRSQIQLLHGSLTYRDKRLKDHDAACLVEVIEHLDPPRLAALEKVVFGATQPPTVIVTTPNVEYNVRFPTLAAGKMRHSDHRFEWTREQFEAWGKGVAETHGYEVTFRPIGLVDLEVGPPTQMAVFRLKEKHEVVKAARSRGGVES